MSERPQTEPLEVLERRYRLLLRAYPRAWREHREDEIIAVLLAGTAGRTRPFAREALDLLRFGLVERCRRGGASAVAADLRAGLGLAGTVALTLLAAFGALQLLVLLPDQTAVATRGSVVLMVIADSACFVAAALCWSVGLRSLALAAIAAADGLLVASAITARHLVVGSFWPLLAGLVGLAAIATAMLGSRRAFGAARRAAGPPALVAIAALLVLVAKVGSWRYAGWHVYVYGGPGNPALHAIPRAFVVAFAIGAVIALVLALARRTRVPLIAATMLSPVLLAGVAARVVQILAGNAMASLDDGQLGAELGCVALLAGCTAILIRGASERHSEQA